MKLRVHSVVVAVVVTAICAGGCVQRNVERIGPDEAASMAPPPPPQTSGARPGSAQVATTQISGVIEVAADLLATVPEDATLYLIVRVAGRTTGAPLAVQQIVAPSFPLEFVITEADAMIAGTPLIGEMSITARVDQDGDAFTSSPGDLRGEMSPVVAGDRNVVILLDEQVSGDR